MKTGPIEVTYQGLHRVVYSPYLLICRPIGKSGNFGLAEIAKIGFPCSTCNNRSPQQIMQMSSIINRIRGATRFRKKLGTSFEDRITDTLW